MLSKRYVLVVVFASFSVTQTLQKQATILRAGPQTCNLNILNL